MNQNTKSNQTGYNIWSKTYDTYSNPTVAIDEFTFPKFWDELRSKDILEIGCGTGRHTTKFLNKENRIIAIDLSEGMLSIARQKIQGEEVDFRLGDFLEMDLTEKFDAIVVSLVIEHIADLAKFFKKVSNCLRPAGKIYISEIHPDKAAAGGRANFLDDETSRQIFFDSFPHSSQSLQDAAMQAGLNLVSANDILGNHQLAALNPEWQKYLDKPMLKIWIFQQVII